MARRGETGQDPASTMSAGGSHGESKGATGLYNVSNTCYLNSVLQALSHVREFRECLLSDEAGVSLYAAGPGRGRSPGRTPVPTPAEEILSFPGFKKKRKRKKGDGGGEEEETTVVPVCTCHPSASRRSRSVDFGAGDRDVTTETRRSMQRATRFRRERDEEVLSRALPRVVFRSVFPRASLRARAPRDRVTWFFIFLLPFVLTTPTPSDAVRPPAMTRTGRANIADADHASLGGPSFSISLPRYRRQVALVAATREDTRRGLSPTRTRARSRAENRRRAVSLTPKTPNLVDPTRRRAPRGASHALVGRVRSVSGTSAERAVCFVPCP